MGWAQGNLMEPSALIKQYVGREPSSPNQLTALALLMFSLNENEGVMRNVRLLRDEVNEIVVIDSSRKESYLELLGQAEEYGVRVYRVIPVGYPEPLIPYGLTKVDSRYVFRLDADEEPSRPLAANLKNLTDCNAYIVPRYELGLRTFTRQARGQELCLSRSSGVVMPTGEGILYNSSCGFL